MIVAQARNAEFYRGYGVPDTVDGRLDMIVLHLVLVLRQLTQAHGALPPAGQDLFDRFCSDMDDNFREMGVGDFGVPKRMQKVAPRSMKAPRSTPIRRCWRRPWRAMYSARL
jgi:cytochrome b pre-mRNA-processing protein 3